RLRREYPFDVIDSHFAYPVGITAALLGTAFGCPFTITLRGNEVMHAQSRGKRRWIRWALRRADRIITVSESLRKFALSQGVDATRVRTIQSGEGEDMVITRPSTETSTIHDVPGGHPVCADDG